MAETKGAVWAAIVTHNRRDVVVETVASVLAQTSPLGGIVVVDNCSEDGTPDLLEQRFGDSVIVVRNVDNGGYATGINLALETVGDQAALVWALNDDSPAQPDALALLTKAHSGFPRAAIVGSTGYRLRFGTPREVRLNAAGRCDCVLIDSTVLDVAAVRAVGGLRGDFFMMWEEFELCDRLTRAGYDVVALPQETSDRRHLGSIDANIWRAYYQARNQLRAAIERRDIKEATFVVVRHLKLAGASLLLPSQRRRWAKAGLRMMGLRDACRNRMGRVPLPGWAGHHP